MSTLSELLEEARQAQGHLNNLRERRSHATTYTERHHFLIRIRRLQHRLDRLYSRITRIEGVPRATVFGTRKKPKTVAGLSVALDISIDGRYFSNPAPKIKNGQRVWIRLRIDMAQKSPFSTAKTDIPTLIRCTWTYPSGWTKLDRYPRAGRIEHVASMPLNVTREFHAPASGSTRASFGVYCDPYFLVEPTNIPPDGADVEVATVQAEIDAGSYYVYTRTSDVLSSRALSAFGTTTIRVDETDQRLFYTDGNTYLLVRLIESGDYPGKYIDVSQDGITLSEAVGALE